MEDVACNLCGSRNAAPQFQQKDFMFRVSDEVFTIVQCADCGLVYLNPRPTIEELGAYYIDSFYKNDRTAEEELVAREKQIREKVRFVEHLPKGRALDIGCMKGDFLHGLQEAGWEVEGTELSTTPSNLFNLDIHYGTDFLTWPSEEDRFDLVTMWAVMEHVHDPMAFFEKIHRVLKPGGRFVYLVTNWDSPHAQWLQMDDYPRHLTIFSRETAQAYADKAGYILKRFVCDGSIYNTSSQGLLTYAFRHKVLREPIEKLAWEYRDNSLEFCHGLKGPRFLRRIWYRFDQLVCGKAFDRMLNRREKGHIITVELENPR
ncbi:MAG: SAM-dependent methyltransferase [Candidatus Omnitrophota bacterium]|jgi:SAM-dependent methyltransferase